MRIYYHYQLIKGFTEKKTLYNQIIRTAYIFLKQSFTEIINLFQFF